jgi:hypothetical protein
MFEESRSPEGGMRAKLHYLMQNKVGRCTKVLRRFHSALQALIGSLKFRGKISF